MTIEELGQQVKKTYPGSYDAKTDKEVGEALIKTYPVYKEKLTPATTTTTTTKPVAPVPTIAPIKEVTPTVVEPTKPKSLLQKGVKVVTDAYGLTKPDKKENVFGKTAQKVADLFINKSPLPEKAKEVAKKVTPVLQAVTPAGTIRPEGVTKLAEQGTLNAMNTPIGQKVVSKITESTSNLPIKAWSKIVDVSDPAITYKEAYDFYKQKSEDPNNTVFEQFLYQLQNSAPQTLVGVALGFVPVAGKALAPAYWTALSADEQIQKYGKVVSLENIGIDVALDSILGSSIEGMLKIPEKTLIPILKKSFISEGGTEVVQSILKGLNNIRTAKDEVTRKQFIQELKDYITSGEAIMEFVVGGVSGAGTAAGAYGIKKATGGNINPQSQTQMGSIGDLKEPAQQAKDALTEYYNKYVAPNETTTEVSDKEVAKDLEQAQEEIVQEEKNLPKELQTDKQTVTNSKTTYRGATMEEWNKVQKTGKFSRTADRDGETWKKGDEIENTWITSEKQYAEQFSDAWSKSTTEAPVDSVVIEFKPEAKAKMTDMTPTTLIGEKLSLQDVAKVTDSKGNIIYEAHVETETKAPEVKTTDKKIRTKELSDIYVTGKKLNPGLNVDKISIEDKRTDKTKEGIEVISQVVGYKTKVFENKLGETTSTDIPIVITQIVDNPTDKTETNLESEAKKYDNKDKFLMSQGALTTDTSYEDKKAILEALNNQEDFEQWDSIIDELKSIGIDEANMEKVRQMLEDDIKSTEDLMAKEKELTDIWNKAQEKTKQKEQEIKDNEEFKQIEDMILGMKSGEEVKEYDKLPASRRTKKALENSVKRIQKAEQEIIKIYKSVDPEALDEAIGNLYQSLDMAEAGRRFFVDRNRNYRGSDDYMWLKQSSSFPDWIPDGVRSKKILNKVLPNLYDVDSIQYPDGVRTAQRKFYDAALQKLDLMLNVDTNELRKTIKKEYDQYQPTRKKETSKITSEEAGQEGVQRVEEPIVESNGGGEKAQPEVKENDLFDLFSEERFQLQNEDELALEDITKQDPVLNTKRQLVVRNLAGEKITIPEGEALAPTVLTNSKIILQDGIRVLVNKSTYEMVKQNSLSEGKAKEFAPELKQTEETVKRDETTKTFEDIKWTRDGENRSGTLDGRKFIVEKEGDNYYVAEVNGLLGRTTRNYTEAVETINRYLQENTSKTSYSKYTLPGGNSYREILIKAPVKISEELPDAFKVVKSSDGSYVVVNSGGARIANSSDTEVGAIQNYNLLNNKPQTFSSSHWTLSNVLAHLRMNLRNFKGKTVSFMEELQSDWARERRKNPEEVIDNPLLKNWQELAVKRALIEAVNDNADYFAWINGEQTSARYNLDKYIDDVNWETRTLYVKDGEEKYKKILIQPKEASEYITVDVDNKGVVFKSSDGNLQGKKLDEVIGKGLAEKIMADESGTLSGEGLRFGGEWARNLYDKQVKNIVEELTGQKVELLDMGLAIAPNKKSWNIANDDMITKTVVTPENLKVGLEIAGENRNRYIVIDVIGDGSFEAIPKSAYDNINPENAKKGIYNPYQSLIEKFNVSVDKSIQQAIKLTPEVKAIIKGEPIKLKQPSSRYEGSSILDNTKTISEEEARNIVYKYFGKDEVTVNFAKEILTPNGRKAFGRQVGNIIEMINNPKESTPYHESVHAFFRNYIEQERKTSLLNEVRKLNGNNLTDIEAEEKLAEGFIDYVKGEEKIKTSNTLVRFYSWLKNMFMKVFRNGGIKQFYKDIVDLRRPTVQLSSFDMSEAYQKQGRKIIDLGNGVKMGGVEDVKPIEMPELLDMYKELTGKIPTINPRLKSALGRFSTPSEQIDLNPLIFMKDFEKTPGGKFGAGMVMAHEIGHLIDYLPERTLRRSSLANRLLSLTSSLREDFDKTNLIKGNNVIKEELQNFVKYWRGVDSLSNYMKQGKELYADALSGLLNNAEKVEEIAPNFYNAWFKFLDNKPEVKDAYFDVQDILNGDPSEVTKKRSLAIDEMFKREDYLAQELQNKKNREKKERRNSLVPTIIKDVVTTLSPIESKTSQALKAGTLRDEDNPIYGLRSKRYLGGKIEVFIEKQINPIFRNITENGLTWDQLGKVLFAERITEGDRSQTANPKGIDPKAAQEQLDQLKQDVGETNYGLLISEADKLRQVYRDLVKKAHDEGFYDDAFFKRSKDNKKYAPFRVLDFYEENISANPKHQKGTLRDIGNPANAYTLKAISLIKALERNKVNKSMIDFYKQSFPDEITPAKTFFNGKAQTVDMVHIPKGKAMIINYEKGRIKGYYVDKYIADAMNDTTIDFNNLVRKTLGVANSKYFRPVFTSLRVGFQISNLVRDFSDFYKNMPNIGMLKALQLYWKAIPIAKLKAFGISEKTRADQVALLDELRENKIFGLTFNQLGGDAVDEEDTQINLLTKKYGINLTEAKTKKGLLGLLMKQLDKVAELGDMIEAIPKIAGYNYLKKQGKMKGEQLADYVRRFAGSPDFSEKGYLTPISNNLMLFSNAMIQGWRRSIEAATQPSTRSGYWTKTVMMNLLPKLAQFLALLGLLGEPLRKMYESISDYDKTNYINLPISYDEETEETAFFRLPQDETGRFIGGLFWKMLETAKEGKVDLDGMEGVFSYTAGQVPNVHPAFKLAEDLEAMLSGNNPYDAYRGQLVLTDQQRKAGGMYAWKPFLKYEFKQLGGSIIYNPSINNSGDKDSKFGTSKKIVSLPIVSDIAGRFFKVSNQGVSEKYQKEVDAIEKEKATEQLKKKEIIDKYVKQAKEGKKENTAYISEKMVFEYFGHTPTTDEEKTEAKAMIQKFEINKIKGGSDPRMDEIIYATSNDVKNKLLQLYKKDISKEDYNKLIELLYNKKVISKNVYELNK